MSSIGYLGPDGGVSFRWTLAEGCSAAGDRSLGAWLEESLTPIAGGLRLYHLVPPGYERYVRVLNPAKDAHGGLVRWRQVAESTGQVIHPEVQWEPLLQGPRGAAPADLVSPWHSNTERHVSNALKRVLFAEEKPSLCRMAVWHGHGGLEESFVAPRIVNGYREYLLFDTPSDLVNDFLRPGGGPLPGIWWPDDRSYCVGTDTDICWSYVGGTSEMIERLLNDSELEVLEVGPDHRADYTSDTINGPVRPS